MGPTKNEYQRKLQRVKTILGTSRSRMQSRKVVRSVASIATAVFLVLDSTINTRRYRKPPNYVRRMKNRCRRYNLLHCQCFSHLLLFPL